MLAGMPPANESTQTDLKKTIALGELRSTLEAFAIRRWRKAGRIEDVGTALRQYLAQLQRAAQKADFESFFQTDHELHRALVEAADLPVLTQSWLLVATEMGNWVRRVHRQYWPSLMALYREHVFLLDALTGPDDQVAEDACHHHIEAGWYRVAAIQRNPDYVRDPVERAVAFISTHYASHLEMGWIARNVSYISLSHLTRLFREKVGDSPYAFLRRTRLERAAQLLQSKTMAVAQIAGRVGYRNVSHFTRDFRTVHGQPPLAYRKQKARGKPAKAGRARRS